MGQQKRDIFPRVARGEYLGALARSEPNTGADLASVSCRARRSSDGWSITGNKYWCTFADGADYLFVLVRTGEHIDPKRRHVGISAFLIHKPRGALPEGVKGSPIPKIGYFGWKTWELAFDDCRVPASALIGEEDKAFAAFFRGLETYRARASRHASSAWRAARWRTPSPMPRSGGSSARPSRSFSPYAFASPPWPPKSRRHGN